MAQLELRYIAAHALLTTRTRGRGSPGGWRHIAYCRCGWNRSGNDWGWRSPRGSMFSDSYITKEEALDSWVNHMTEVRPVAVVDVGNLFIEVVG